MHGIYADTRFDDLGFDTRSQWIGRRKQYLSYGIQTAHDSRRIDGIHDIFVSMTVNRVLDFEDVCEARPSCSASVSGFQIFKTATSTNRFLYLFFSFWLVQR